MEEAILRKDDISVYIEDREYIANTYVLRCVTRTMLIYTIAVFLDVLGVFVVDQALMLGGYIPALIIYLVVNTLTKRISLSNEKMKYLLLFSAIMIYTIMGMTITYHVILVSILPFLYGTLYSSKRVMKYVYFMSFVSTVLIVYGGYYFGLCDANMALLTCNRLADYVSNGQFTLTTVNPNPHFTLFLYFVVPRCAIYWAFVLVCNNITKIVSGSLEKAKLTVELEKAKEAAEAASNAKSQFLARMSHEIRTPINAVLGMNEMILRESKETDIQKYAYDIKISASALLNIINEILDSSKIESGKMEIVSGNYEIGSLLNNLYNMISIKAKDKGLDLEFDIDSTIPGEYFGDDKRIEQIVLNLLTNAVKYTNEGKVTLKVTGRVEGENAILHYSVKDTGIGIREEDIGKIFDAFQRIDAERNRYVEGTGLGMNIVLQFLRLMGSDLQIQSEYEKGSEFSFDLVQKIVNAEPLGDFSERLRQVTEEYDYHTGYIAPEARVLVVDDNKMNLTVFRSLLKQTQIQVFEAESGRTCLNMLKQQSFDLIFLDHMMPEMDGIETLHVIQKEKLCENTPIIMLTANAIFGEKEKYLKEGFDDFLTKPIIQDRLDKMILNYLPGHLVTTGEYIKETKQTIGVEGMPKIAEFDFEYAIECLGSKDVLMQTLESFAAQLEQVYDKLPTLIGTISQEETRKAYRIEVHTLKSTSAMVGALLLSNISKLLEVAATEGDIARIQVLNPILLEEIKTHRERLEVLFPKEQSAGKEARTVSVPVDENGDDLKKTVLLVDDSAVQLRALYGMLKEKYNVQMATSGMKALELLKKKVPDVILLDYEMPELDGKMTLQKIREMDEVKGVPVIFLSGISDEQHIREICELQPAGYLVKPATAETIHNVLQKI